MSSGYNIELQLQKLATELFFFAQLSTHVCACIPLENWKEQGLVNELLVVAYLNWIVRGANYTPGKGKIVPRK